MRIALLLLLTSLAASAQEDMVSIPEGDFAMGRPKLTADDKTNMRPHVLLDDRPVRTVHLSAYQMDKYEVTNAKYAEFVAATMRKPPYHWAAKVEPGHPVYNVTWQDAADYCAWAGGKRLPTEAEWERAARGGLEGKDYPTGDQLTAKMARYNVPDGPGAVGAFPPNGLGLYDMAGNLSEWTADWFAGDYYKSGENLNPKGPPEGLYKVIRGGAWSDPQKRLTVWFRNWVRPNQRTPNIGFRCAK